ncbi:hypothetical protein H8356DRAFT_1357216 [Neocallimastix lanati (nom. inval.)]|nr:hypothetical protein H8356DRAFT_1357216 [Neocallimastix sp. JGI-2020a]
MSQIKLTFWFHLILEDCIVDYSHRWYKEFNGKKEARFEKFFSGLDCVDVEESQHFLMLSHSLTVVQHWRSDMLIISKRLRFVDLNLQAYDFHMPELLRKYINDSTCATLSSPQLGQRYENNIYIRLGEYLPVKWSKDVIEPGPLCILARKLTTRIEPDRKY